MAGLLRYRHTTNLLILTGRHQKRLILNTQCVCLYICVCLCVCVRARARVRVCVCVCVSVR